MNVRCEWGSINPGINVAPRPSNTSASDTSASTVSGRSSSGHTPAIVSPSTSTRPRNGGAPVQSRMLTCLNRVRIEKWSALATCDATGHAGGDCSLHHHAGVCHNVLKFGSGDAISQTSRSLCGSQMAHRAVSVITLRPVYLDSVSKLR